ncbi:RNA polymerase sigma-70 factor [Sphingobacterium sp. SGG-5]|nr:RNA polymerase sigma-70 factor [Sphingobacterium sp. SGG-5]
MEFFDEKLLLAEIKNGNNEAFEYIFKSYYPRLQRYAARFIDDQAVVEDIIQECFIRFWEKKDMLSAISVSSLLFTMVRNSCLNYLKHLTVVEKHRIEYLAKAGGEERLYYTDFLLDTEHKLLYKELQEQIDMVIDQLPKRCREVFLMSRFEGLKNREIAEALQISTTAVEKHISKALQQFSAYFKHKYPMDVYIMILAWIIGR